MSLEVKIEVDGLVLTEVETQRIRRSLAALERRLVHRPEPMAVLALARRAGRREAEAGLRLQLEPLGALLVSHQSAPTAAKAARLAVADIERQLERHVARQRGEASYGTPSRRRVEEGRPAQAPAGVQGPSPVG